MARFTASVPLSMLWRGVYEFVGTSSTTYRIDDALYDEFNTEFTGKIAGLTWVDTDELSPAPLTSPIAESDVTGLVADLAAKYPTTGGTITGSVTATGTLGVGGAATFSAALTGIGAAVFSASLVAQSLAGVIMADRYSSIQAAINAAPAVGAEVFIPAGTYSISSALLLPANVWLRGAGRGTKITQTANTPVVQVATGVTNVKVSDLWIVGTATTATTTAFGAYVASGCSDVIFSDLQIDTCYRGVSVVSSSRVTVQNCTVTSDKSNLGAIDVSASSYVTIRGCRITDPTTHGVDFREGGGYNTAVDCTVNSSGSTGFVISGSSATGLSLPGCSFIGCMSIIAGVTATTGCGFIAENGAQFARIEGCHSLSAALDGILVAQGSGDRPSGCDVVGNTIRSAGRHGVYVIDASYTVVSGNRVSVFAGDGIRVNQGASGQITGATTVAGNVVSDGSATTGAGIQAIGSAEGTVISGNAVRNTAGYGILVDAPRVTVTGNTVMDSDNGGTLTIGGITVTANGDRSIVVGNTSHRISGTKQDYGVDVQAGCVSAIVVGNVLFQNVTGGLLDNGTTTSTNNNVSA